MGVEKRAPLSLKCIRFAFQALGRPFPGLVGRVAHALWFRPAVLGQARLPSHREFPGARTVRIPFASGWVTARLLGSSGPAVAFVHGWGGSSTQFSAFWAGCLERGFRVIALDLPAHGLSSGHTTDIAAMAHALEVALGSLGPAEALVTHSLGATCAMLALNRGLAVRCAVCLAPPAGFAEMVAKVGEVFHYPVGVVAALRRLLEKDFGPDVWSTFSTHENAKGLRLPGLVIHDRHDRWVPYAEGKLVSDAWSGSRFLTTEDLGHYRLLFDPIVIRETISFLSDHTGRPAAPAPALGERVIPAPGIEADGEGLATT